MFDATTAALIREAPRLRGVDPQTLPQELTSIYAELIALRMRGDQLEAQPERAQVMERLKRLATVYEAIVDTGSDGNARRASAFVAGTAHHILGRVAEDPRRSAERQRALELLAASPDGCTAAILMAHGFKSDRLVELINAGLASVTTERMIAADRAMEVTRVRITDAGRQALASDPTARR
jgi:hypothetical protein